jgi:hypothetical protein
MTLLQYCFSHAWVAVLLRNLAVWTVISAWFCAGWALARPTQRRTRRFGDAPRRWFRRRRRSHYRDSW